MEVALKESDLSSSDAYTRALAIANFVDYLKFLEEVGKITKEKLDSIIEILMSKDKESVLLGIELMIAVWKEFKN